jgi:hypothetical protein
MGPLKKEAACRGEYLGSAWRPHPQLQGLVARRVLCKTCLNEHLWRRRRLSQYLCNLPQSVPHHASPSQSPESATNPNWPRATIRLGKAVKEAAPQEFVRCGVIDPP